ncbi:MAG: multidrug effflux MFS transporter [Pararhodobacter sp.]|nr:multidrug effflux MFS transporter [Pararhodobacter sp.]
MTPPTVRFLDRSTPPHIATLILLAGLSALSMNIFLPSLPRMAEHFGVDYAVMQLSVSLYLGASALLQVVIGPLSDRFGRRTLILWSIALFTLATLGTLLAPTAESFLFFRTAQAVVATGMALSRAIARDMVDEARAASMIGYVTMGMSVAPMLGPMIGGFLEEAFGWQASFHFLLILGVLMFALLWFDLGETSKRRPTSLAQQFREYPELFSSPRFWGYVAIAGFGSGVFFAYLGGGPFVGSEHFGLSASGVGLYFGLTALGYGFGNFLSGRYSVHVGTHKMVFWGSLLPAATVALLCVMEFAGVVSAEVFFGMFLFVGIGNGLLLPNATAGMLSVRPHLAGTASGVGAAFMIGLGAALSAIAGVLLKPGSGPMPLLLIMLVSSTLSVLAALYVIHRARRLGM